MNQVVLVGRIAKIREEENNTIITLAIHRNYKNADGEYEIDFIDCQLFGEVATKTIEYCRTGDMVGIKGRLQVNNKKMIVVADRLTFLTARYNKNNEEEE